jgi:hypothetical protein
MGLAIDKTRINGTPFSWTSMETKIDNVPYVGILEINWEEKRERKVVYAGMQDGTPLGKTAGKYSVSGFTLKMLRASATLLKQQMTAKGAGSHGDPEFTIFVSIAEPALFPGPITYTCSRCTIDGEKDSHAEGIDELVTEFEIGCLSVSEDRMQLSSLVRSL